MAQTLKRIYAGGQQVDVLYSRGSRYDGPAQRAAKQKASSEAQRRINQIYSWQKLELMLSTNFPTAGSGLVVTLTCDDRHQPKNRKQMARWLSDWRRRMNQEREAARLPELVAFWCIEVLTSDSGHWHAHLVINSTGTDAEMIRRSWPQGSVIQMDKLRVDQEKNWETLARYMTKEARECQDDCSRVGLRGWSYTRNAKKPETETLTVGDDYQLTAPEGCTVLVDEKKRTEFASWQVLKYRFDSVRNEHQKARAVRRKAQRPRVSF